MLKAQCHTETEQKQKQNLQFLDILDIANLVKMENTESEDSKDKKIRKSQRSSRPSAKKIALVKSLAQKCASVKDAEAKNKMAGQSKRDKSEVAASTNDSDSQSDMSSMNELLFDHTKRNYGMSQKIKIGEATNSKAGHSKQDENEVSITDDSDTRGGMPSIDILINNVKSLIKSEHLEVETNCKGCKARDKKMKALLALNQLYQINHFYGGNKVTTRKRKAPKEPEVFVAEQSWNETNWFDLDHTEVNTEIVEFT